MDGKKRAIHELSSPEKSPDAKKTDMSDFPGLPEPGSPVKSQKSDIRTGKFGKNSERGGRGGRGGGNGRGKGSRHFQGGDRSVPNKIEGGNANVTSIKSTPIEPEISKQEGGEASSPPDDDLNNEVEISDAEMTVKLSPGNDALPLKGEWVKPPAIPKTAKSYVVTRRAPYDHSEKLGQIEDQCKSLIDNATPELKPYADAISALLALVKVSIDSDFKQDESIISAKIEKDQKKAAEFKSFSQSARANEFRAADRTLKIRDVEVDILEGGRVSTRNLRDKLCDHVKDLNAILPQRIEVKAIRSANQKDKKATIVVTLPTKERRDELAAHCKLNKISPGVNYTSSTFKILKSMREQIPVKAGLSEEEHILIRPNRDYSKLVIKVKKDSNSTVKGRSWNWELLEQVDMPLSADEMVAYTKKVRLFSKSPVLNPGNSKNSFFSLDLNLESSPTHPSISLNPNSQSS